MARSFLGSIAFIGSLTSIASCTSPSAPSSESLGVFSLSVAASDDCGTAFATWRAGTNFAVSRRGIFLNGVALSPGGPLYTTGSLTGVIDSGRSSLSVVVTSPINKGYRGAYDGTVLVDALESRPGFGTSARSAGTAAFTPDSPVVPAGDITCQSSSNLVTLSYVGAE